MQRGHESSSQPAITNPHQVGPASFDRQPRTSPLRTTPTRHACRIRYCALPLLLPPSPVELYHLCLLGTASPSKFLACPVAVGRSPLVHLLLSAETPILDRCANGRPRTLPRQERGWVWAIDSHDLTTQQAKERHLVVHQRHDHDSCKSRNAPQHD